MQGCLRRDEPDHASGQGISEPRGANMSTAQRAVSLYHLARGIPKPRVGKMSQAKLTGRPRAQHLGAWSCEGVSGEIGRTTPRAASLKPNLRRCLKRNRLDDLLRGISEPRVARMSRANLAGPPQDRASLNPVLRGCLRRDGPDHVRSRHL